MQIHVPINISIGGESIERGITITFTVDDAGIPVVNVTSTTELVGGRSYSADWLWSAISYTQNKSLERLMLRQWRETEDKGMSIDEALVELRKLQEAI